MTTATPVPLNEYLTTSYSPDCEWVDGELQETNMGEFSHSSVQRLLLKFFLTRESELQIAAYPELRLQVSAENYRVPDILVRKRAERYQRIIVTPPLLCIEILSPEDRMSAMQRKIADYLGMGVGTVWVIDPQQRTALVIDGHGQRPADTLTLPGYDVHLPLRDVFAELDELEHEMPSAQ